MLILPAPIMIATPESIAGRLSGHWPPHQVSLSSVATAELARTAQELKATEIDDPGCVYYLFTARDR